MAAHYGLAGVPARPAKPRAKAKVEAAVLVVERWILAVLRQRQFFSLGELDEAIAELLERLNNRPFRKREGTRLRAWLATRTPRWKISTVAGEARNSTCWPVSG